MIFERQWRWDDVAWGETLCAARCGRPADLVYTGSPLCAADAERLVERQQLLAEAPELARNLPPVFRADEA